MSLPLRERGLKYMIYLHILIIKYVTPFVGAWIEITIDNIGNTICGGRSFRGSVDWNERGFGPACEVKQSLPLRERGLKYGFHRQSLPDPELYLILKILPPRQRQQKNWKNMYRITVSKEYPRQPIYWRPDIYRTLHQFQKNQPVTAVSICRRKVKNFWVWTSNF